MLPLRVGRRGGRSGGTSKGTHFQLEDERVWGPDVEQHKDCGHPYYSTAYVKVATKIHIKVLTTKEYL